MLKFNRHSFLLAAVFLASVARACENVLTHAEIAADRALAVEFFDPTFFAYFGVSVSSAGDVNADGLDDFAIAASYESSGGVYRAGVIYLIFGRSAAQWANATFDFSSAETPDPTSWIRISGNEAEMLLGGRGVTFGDYNGDGLGDLVFGCSKVGQAFCVFGHSGGWSSFNVSEIESGSVPGFAITGGSGTISIAGNAGDLNGDGIADILVSDVDGSNPATAYVVYGNYGTSRGTFNLRDIDGTNGFSFSDGSTHLGIGSVGPAGDYNGDGLNDLAVGADRVKINVETAGRAYILFARNVSATGQPWPASFNLTAEIDGTNGFIVTGPATNAYLGSGISSAGDVNEDGFEDVFINSGMVDAWIVFGHPAPWNSPFSASQLDGTNGFCFTSVISEYFGRYGGAAGDINGDGVDDIVIGGHGGLNSTGTKTGAVVVLFGHSGAWPAELDRNDAVGSVGFLIDGPAENSQFSIACCAGDVNGDGISDVIVGAPAYNNNKGYAALVFGVADDHCAVCSNFTDACLVCDDGFILNSTACEAAVVHASSSELHPDEVVSSSSSPPLPAEASIGSSSSATAEDDSSSIGKASSQHGSLSLVLAIVLVGVAVHHHC